MSASGSSSYVVTLELDPDSFAWLDGLRRRNFPVARNVLDAHLTLFHQLDEEGRAIVETCVDPAAAAVPLSFARPRSLGRGVAIEVVSPELMALRRALAAALDGRLTRQDAQPFRPHVTIQNKVDPAMARALLNELAPTFIARSGQGTGVVVWEYLGGPWRRVTCRPLG